MLHAVEAPSWKTLALAGLAVAGMTGAAIAHHKHHHPPTVHRLALDAPVRPNAFYLTAWAEGDITLAFDGQLEPMTIKTRALMDDGCRWLATETLIPADATHYAYTYDEQILSCEPGATPYVETPRTGVVTVY